MAASRRRPGPGLAAVRVAGEAAEVAAGDELTRDGAGGGRGTGLRDIRREQRRELLPVRLRAVEGVGDQQLELACTEMFTGVYSSKRLRKFTRVYASLREFTRVYSQSYSRL
jgi:hypothetical protein